MNNCGKYRNILVTHNNWTDQDYNKWLDHDWFSYIVIGKEKCPTTGTPHLHIYAELKKQTRIGTLHREFPGAHILFARGNQEQCQTYCKKDNDYVEKGHPRHPGRPRIERNKIRELVTADVPLREAFLENDMTFNDIKFYQKVQDILDEPVYEKREVIWICGESGSGKTTLARELMSGSCYEKNDSKWWDGWDGHETIILNDWRPSRYWNASNTLKFLGGEPLRIEMKGYSRWLKCKRIIITCCDRPEEIWEKNHKEEQVKQLLRRISKTYVCWMDQDRVKGNNKTLT